MSIGNSLSGLTVVDLGRGLSAALVARMLTGLGASVRRFEPLSGDPFRTVYPAYATLHAGSVVEQVARIDAPEVLDRIAAADIVILGGEDYPDYDWGLDADTLSAERRELYVLDIAAYPAGGEGKAVDHLVQARSGISAEHYTDRPIRTGFEAAGYGAALQGLLGLLAAIYSGEGQVVRTSYYEGALSWAMPFWSRADNPGPRFNFVLPKDPAPLIFRCRDGRYIQFVMGSAGAKPKVYSALGIDTSQLDPNDSGQPTGAGDPRKIFGDIDLLAAHAIKIDSQVLLDRLQRDGVAAELAQPPGHCWDDPQVVHAGLVTTSPEGWRSTGLPIRGDLLDARSETQTGAKRGGGGPLAGLRVLDFGLFVAGPLAPMCLADLGADVIKVEPLTGDANRMLFKSFASCNRGKRSIAVDMKSAAGQQIVQKLSDGADVIISNFRPGVSARLGIDPASVHARDPNKIVLEVTGYGRDGPKGELAGWDMVLQALCGHEMRAGGKGNPPLWTRSTMVDYATGLLGAISVLAALCARARGRAGADLHASLLATGVFLLSELVGAPDGRLLGGELLNAQQTGFHPAESMYQTADGWLAVSARNAAMASRLERALGLNLGGRESWAEEVQDKIAEVFALRTTHDWLETLRRADVWCEPCVTTGADYLDNPDLEPRTQVVEFDGGPHGRVRQPGQLFRLSTGTPASHTIVSGLGEYSDAVLDELGYDQATIKDLRTQKVVG